MSDDKRLNEKRDLRADAAATERTTPRRTYRKPQLKSGERMEKTTLASCLTGAACGPFAFEA